MIRYFLLPLSAALLLGSAAFAQPYAADAEHPRRAEVIQFAEHWLSLVEAGHAEASFELLAPSFLANLTFDEWEGVLQRERREWGELKGRDLHRIVWYQDPQDAPLPGLYVAVEFNSEYENTERHFQYLILHSRSGEPFRVMRRESTVALSSLPADVEEPVN